VFELILSRIASVLNSVSFPYMLFGGQAVIIHGEPRFTRDIDITLGLDPNDCEKFLPLLPKMQLKSLIANPIDLLKETFVLPVQDENSDIRVDFVFALSEFEKLALKRAIKIEIRNTSINVISAEDLVITKIIAGRGRDLDDVKNILLTQKSNLDEELIRKYLKLFDIELDGSFLFKFEEIKYSLPKSKNIKFD
jgi:hypothetical protein